MTPAEFRRTALRLQDTAEASHMGHPDFRVAGKIFATLGYPRTGFGVVMLSPEGQAFFVRAQGEGFAPVRGAWGDRGATMVTLAPAKAALVRAALRAAWEHRRPKRARDATSGRRRRGSRSA
jgi:hypothetical protein